MDNLRYSVQSRHDDFIIVFDKLDKSFAIHSKDENDDKAMITGFEYASDAIDFALKRVNKKEIS